MYDLLITAAVPLICRIDAAVLLCNSPRGYDLYAQDQAGEIRTLDHGDGPVRKPVTYTLRDGEHLLLVAR